MANKPTKPINHAKVITPEQIRQQKENQALAMLVQKREAFAINILVSLVKGWNYVSTDKVTAVDLVDRAVEMADHLLEKLYPTLDAKEQKNEKTTAEEIRKELKGNLKEEICGSDVCALRGRRVCTITRDQYCPMFTEKDIK